VGRLVINNAMTVNGAFEAPSPDEWLVLDADNNNVSISRPDRAPVRRLRSRRGNGDHTGVRLHGVPEICQKLRYARPRSASRPDPW
jgi:hypothetical protein